MDYRRYYCINVFIKKDNRKRVNYLFYGLKGYRFKGIYIFREGDILFDLNYTMV
jgi:hypothetical protein